MARLQISTDTLRRWKNSKKLPPPDVDVNRETQAWKRSTLEAAGIFWSEQQSEKGGRLGNVAQSDRDRTQTTGRHAMKTLTNIKRKLLAVPAVPAVRAVALARKALRIDRWMLTNP
jgi:hypothetical protein